MAQSKLDLDSISIEDLKKLIEEKQKKEEEAKQKPFFDIKKMIEDQGFTVEQFTEWHKEKFSPIVFEHSYTIKGETKTFTRQKGQIGLIPKDIKTALRSLGYDVLKKGIKPGFETEGAKVVESIFKDRKTKP